MRLARAAREVLEQDVVVDRFVALGLGLTGSLFRG